MKKYLKITILTIIIMLISYANVYAGNATVTLTPSKTEVKVGDTFSVTLLVKCETGIEALDSTLQYDKTKLELTDTTVDKNFADISGANASTGAYKLSFLWNSENDATKEVELVKLNFKVLDNVKANDSISISLSDIQLNDSDDKWIDIASQETTIKVVESQSKPNENTNTPGGNHNENKDNTQYNNVISYAGLQDYTFAVIAGIVLIASIAYAKYKQYKNI